MYNKSGGNDVSRWKLWKNYHCLCYHLKKLWKEEEEEVMFAQRIILMENSILYWQKKKKKNCTYLLKLCDDRMEQHGWKKKV